MTTNDYVNDPGHGGSDPGAVSHGNTEKVYTLEAALYVDKRLGDHGITSSMTRTTDKTLDEDPRVSAVISSKADRCLSHHYNAGGGTGAEFIHSIYSDGKLENIMSDEFKKAGFPVRRVFDRKGSNGDYYYMHRRTGSVSTTIVEYDFVDGGNREKIKSKPYREKMYECVVKSVCRFEGVAYKPLLQPTKPKEDDEMEEKAIVINTFNDYPNAEPLANRLGCGIFTRKVAEKHQVAKEIYIVGGSKDGIKGNKFVMLTGPDRYDVAAVVKKFLDK